MSERAVRLTLPWSVLAQVNHRMIPRRGGKGLTLSREYRDKKAAAEALVCSQYRGLPVPGAVVLTLRFFEPDRRRRDPSNLVKLIEDALSGIAYEDDSQIHRETWERAGVDKLEPRVEIEISALERAA